MNDEEFRDLLTVGTSVSRGGRRIDPRIMYVSPDPLIELRQPVHPEPEDLPLRQGEVGTYTDARFHRQLETLRLDRWHHPTPDRYYTGDARMPAPPMSMLRPMVRLLARDTLPG